MVYIFLVFILIFSGLFLYLFHPKFGAHPSGQRLQRIKNSPHFKNDSFKNINPTPDLTEGANFFSVLFEFLFRKRKRSKPKGIIPSNKTDLMNLPLEEDVLVWFGHSSYFLQIDGKRILVDPVFCGNASPLSFTTKAFDGTNIYSTSEIPDLDLVFITHDHWDHLDYSAIKDLKERTNKFICGLGVGAHLASWGVKEEKIVEMDWNEEVVLDPAFRINCISARHFSGRGLLRNRTLWASFALQTHSFNLFIGGDSGYDEHFAEVGRKFGPFDLVILENGQYDRKWKYIHMLPEEVLMAAKDLGSKKLFPVHSSKFSLALHEWDEPLKKISSLNKENILLVTPVIGEKVVLNKEMIRFKPWWEDLE